MTTDKEAVPVDALSAAVETFNSSTSKPFGSYLRIHNTNSKPGVITIAVCDDVSGDQKGYQFECAIAGNATMQWSAAQIEDLAEIPTTRRDGTYTLCVTGNIAGYVQHILFDSSTFAVMPAPPATQGGEGERT